MFSDTDIQKLSWKSEKFSVGLKNILVLGEKDWKSAGFVRQAAASVETGGGVEFSLLRSLFYYLKILLNVSAKIIIFIFSFQTDKNTNSSFQDKAAFSQLQINRRYLQDTIYSVKKLVCRRQNFD